MNLARTASQIVSFASSKSTLSITIKRSFLNFFALSSHILDHVTVSKIKL